MSTINEKPGHSEGGTAYGQEAATAYIQTTHHTDRERFLTGYIGTLLSDLSGLKVIDIGAGTGPWSIYATQHGAESVVAIDYQEEMTRQASIAVTDAGLEDKITIQKGDAAELKYPPEIFDTALSIQVGCNLPQSSFGRHFSELARVLRKDGKAVVTAPDSFGTVFTGGEESGGEILQLIHESLLTINGNNTIDTKIIQDELTKLKNVYLATFALRDGKLVLITDENELRPGEEIWRKLPGLVVPNFYHSVGEYKEEFTKNNLEIIKEFNEGFATEQEREGFNSNLAPESKLGESYVGHAPFAVWELRKTL